jgi:hypothetical protein
MSSIVIAQGGGPTAVINQTLCGAILAARRHDPSLRILGARYGVRGLTAGNVVDLTSMPEDQLRRLGNTPNSALGSTRDKPGSGACSDILAAPGSMPAPSSILAAMTPPERSNYCGNGQVAPAISCMPPRPSITT